MRTHPANRPRLVTEPVTTVGGLSRIMQGLFGKGSPAHNSSAEVTLDPAKVSGFYHAYEADIFTPGTSNWVIDPTHDGPLTTVWGHAFLRNPNGFNPIQTPQIYSNPATTLIGAAGLISGQMITQPLSENAQGSANQ